MRHDRINKEAKPGSAIGNEPILGRVRKFASFPQNFFEKFDTFCDGIWRYQ